MTTPNATGTVGRNPDTGQFTSLSMEDAGAALSSLLNPEGDNQGEAEATTDQDEEADAEGSEEQTEEGTETESDQEGTEDEEDSEEESDEDEEPGSDEDDQRGKRPGRLYTVRIDGKDERISESELIAGYSRQSDYTRKTQALANDRKQVEQESEAARTERAEYQRLLPQLRQSLEQMVGKEPDWAAIQAQDAKDGTNHYANTYIAWEQHKQRLARVDAEAARVEQKAKAEAKAAAEKRLGQERDALLLALPTWKDPKVAKRDSNAIARVMKSVGYADKEIAVHDHRALQIALKAARYDALMANQPKLRQQLQRAPVVKPGSGATPPRSSQVNQARKRLDQSGSVKDAASLLENFL